MNYCAELHMREELDLRCRQDLGTARVTVSNKEDQAV